MSERMRGTDSDRQEATALWTVDHLAQRVRELTAERDALKKKLAKTQQALTASEQEAQALKDEIEYTFTHLGNPLINRQPSSPKDEPFSEYSAKLAALFEPSFSADNEQD